jgi:hypothetical protein
MARRAFRPVDVSAEPMEDCALRCPPAPEVSRFMSAFRSSPLGVGLGCATCHASRRRTARRSMCALWFAPWNELSVDHALAGTVELSNDVYMVGALGMDAITYTAARANLASAMARECSDHEALIITRNGKQFVVMLWLEGVASESPRLSSARWQGSGAGAVERYLPLGEAALNRLADGIDHDVNLRRQCASREHRLCGTCRKVGRQSCLQHRQCRL